MRRNYEKAKRTHSGIILPEPEQTAGYSPTQIICVSFVIVIALGTLLLLSLPIASRYGRMG